MAAPSLKQDVKKMRKNVWIRLVPLSFLRNRVSSCSFARTKNATRVSRWPPAAPTTPGPDSVSRRAGLTGHLDSWLQWVPSQRSPLRHRIGNMADNQQDNCQKPEG